MCYKLDLLWLEVHLTRAVCQVASNHLPVPAAWTNCNLMSLHEEWPVHEVHQPQGPGPSHEVHQCGGWSVEGLWPLHHTRNHRPTSSLFVRTQPWRPQPLGTLPLERLENVFPPTAAPTGIPFTTINYNWSKTTEDQLISRHPICILFSRPQAALVTRPPWCKLQTPLIIWFQTL